MIMVAWGIAACSMAFVKTAEEFYFVRVLLGLAEAGTFPGIWLYFSHFFPENRLTLPVAINEVGVALSQVVAGPIGAILLSLDGVLNLAGWQWLFFIEGLPPVLLGIFFYFKMPRSPGTANFLTSQESDWLNDEIARSRSKKGLSSPDTTLWTRLRECLTNRQLWGLTCVKFLRDLTAYTTLFYTPLLLATMMDGSQEGLKIDPEAHSCSVSAGRKDSLVALLTTIPFASSALSSFLVSWHSQRVGERKYHIAIVFWSGSVLFSLLPWVNRWGTFWGVLSLTAGVVGSSGAGGGVAYPWPLQSALRRPKPSVLHFTILWVTLEVWQLS